MQKVATPGVLSPMEFIKVEEFDPALDTRFIKESLIPYFKDLFRDLALRSSSAGTERQVDKVAFQEYCQLPGIINDRLFCMFQEHKDALVTENNFISTFIKIFVSDIESKMKLTFDMYVASPYDFDADGHISKEDVRIVLSYIPFIREQGLVQGSSPEATKKIKDNITFSSFVDKVKEGSYKSTSETAVSYNDRISDQEEIKNFLDQIFQGKKLIGFSEYLEINRGVSSEMYYSIMATLHERLPCAPNIFRLKSIFRGKVLHGSVRKSQSPVRAIASPSIVRGLSKFAKPGSCNMENKGAMTPTVNNKKIVFNGNGSVKSRRMSNASSVIVSELFDSNNSNSEESKVMMNYPQIGVEPFREDQVASPSNFRNGNFKMSIQKATNRQRPGPNLNQLSINTGELKFKNTNDFSPLTPSKTTGLRLGTRASNTSMRQPDQGTHLPDIKPPANQSNRNKLQPIKSTFSKKTSAQGNIDSRVSSAPRSHESPEDELDDQNAAEQQIIDSYSSVKATDQKMHEGNCYLKTKSDRYKQHWAISMGNELYCYRHKTDTTHRVMHSLVGTFIKDLPEEADPDHKNCFFWPVKVVLPPNKSRVLYFQSHDEQQAWMTILKQAVGYTNLFDFYDLGKTLGKGQFGLVKLALHKRTGQQVAIKTVKKKDMKSIEIYQQRREIEVLKMCQHPNIVKLIDLFENSDYYYIVLEYMEGKDMFDYLQKRNFKISEERARHLALQIADGIKYLHSYGIVHRDLKLENIMVSDGTEHGMPKIVDFGLAKIIGPNETAVEPFGTLGYVAPEVLKKQPYSYSCDLWSLGCIIYALLSGSLPFDHDNQKETIRMTLNDPLVFDLPCWTSVSDSAKDLITGLLIKDPSKRLNLTQCMQHEWMTGSYKSPKKQ